MQTLTEAPQDSHVPLAGASAAGDVALQELLEKCNAPDTLKRLSAAGQECARIALCVVWPMLKPLTFGRQRGSDSSGGQGESSIFECRMVDVRGDSCLFRVYVDGDPSSKVVKDRGAALMEQFFDGSAWVFSKLKCRTVLKTPEASGCSVGAVLSWGSDVKEPPLEVMPVLERTRLGWAPPRVSLPVAGLGDLAGLC